MRGIDRFGKRCPRFSELSEEELVQVLSDGLSADAYSEWATNFVESILRQIRQRGKDALSDKQIAVLDGRDGRDGVIFDAWEST